MSDQADVLVRTQVRRLDGLAVPLRLANVITNLISWNINP
jgi:hypothetical protein